MGFKKLKIHLFFPDFPKCLVIVFAYHSVFNNDHTGITWRHAVVIALECPNQGIRDVSIFALIELSASSRALKFVGNIFAAKVDDFVTINAFGATIAELWRLV